MFQKHFHRLGCNARSRCHLPRLDEGIRWVLHLRVLFTNFTFIYHAKLSFKALHPQDGSTFHDNLREICGDFLACQYLRLAALDAFDTFRPKVPRKESSAVTEAKPDIITSRVPSNPHFQSWGEGTWRRMAWWRMKYNYEYVLTDYHDDVGWLVVLFLLLWLF